MADFNQINQFGSAKPGRSGAGVSCVEFEAMLTDAIDGVLSAKDQGAFDLHLATCHECSQMLADAKRGAALLEMLKMPRPEPPALLLEKILSATSGAQASGLTVPVKSRSADMTMQTADGAGVDGHRFAAPVYATPSSVAPQATFEMGGGKVLPFRSPAKFSLRAITHTMMQPRLAMTAAMAFFSIALTMNLTGVHLNQLRASDLKPSSLKRSFYQADASVVRYYDNLRVVYELQTRMHDLQRPDDNEAPAAVRDPGTQDGGSSSPAKDKSKPEQRKSSKAGSGTSQRHDPLDEEFRLASGPGGPRVVQQAVYGTENLAGMRWMEFSRSSGRLKEELQEGGSV